MKAKIKILRGRTVLFSGTVEMNKKAYENEIDPTEAFAEDLFNVERYINEQGAYRCHTAIEENEQT